MLSAPAAVCRNHKKRERVATCGICSSALCVDCIVHTAVGVKCRSCTGGAAATAPNATRAARESKARDAGAKKRRWAVPVAAAGALLMVAGGVAVLSRGGGSGSTVVADAPAVEGGDHDSSAGSGGFVDRKADFPGAGGLNVGATLSVPGGLGNGRAPAVLIIPGGGAQDRNGGIQIGTQLPDPLYADLAETFAQNGIVSLRYDRRGSPSMALPENTPLRWDDLLADAKAGLDFLSERRETEGQPITVLGYDQGGFIAMRLAATDPRVKGVVLLSTPARSFAEVVAHDFERAIADPVKAQEVAAQARSAADELVRTGAAPDLQGLHEEIRLIFQGSIHYLSGLFAFDPLAEASRVRAPTLLVRGGADGSILASDVEALGRALANHDTVVAPAGSNTLALPPGAEGRFHNPSRHGTTRDGDATFAIADWVKTNVRS
ncbi:MAG: alpha/beta fold hydrolase [Actinomycetota bacterium]